jgi:outer membrane protein assembly factor BamD
MFRRIAWLLLIILLAGCARNKIELSTENKLVKADELYAKKKYSKAAILYDEISFEKKSASSAVALMKLADCYFQINKFTDARLKYTMMTTSYPDYTDIETAYFRIGVSYFEETLPPQYDQTETAQAIEAFRTFLDRFPSSDKYPEAIDYIRKCQSKLIQKKYHNGFIYYRMKDYSSALMYFDQITELGNLDKLDRQSLYYSIKIHIAQKNSEAANLAWQKLNARYPDSKEVSRLKRHF